MVLKKINAKLPQFSLSREKIVIPSNVHLADPNFHIPSEIDILLDADIYYSLINGLMDNKHSEKCLDISRYKGYIIGGLIRRDPAS